MLLSQKFTGGENIGYYNNFYPRDKHATISVLTFRQQDLPKQDEYIENVQTEFLVQWLKSKSDVFQTEIARTIESLNAQFHPRGKNRILECLQFGGNSEFWQGFVNEGKTTLYFRRCYDFAVNYIGFLKSDKNIICAVTIIEPNRRNLFVYYLPVTDRWQTKVMSNEESENGNKLPLRDESGNPIYRTERLISKPLLCHSEFWKQRGEELSYSILQESFYQAIAKHYGAERGESTSPINHSEPQPNTPTAGIFCPFLR